jgi:uncharacterized protein YjlB
MLMEPQTANIEEIQLRDDGVFPNSRYPVLLYKGVLDIPILFPAAHVRRLFEKNGWYNSWDAGIFEYHHYHSITPEVLGVYRGHTNVQLGGHKGPKIFVEKGDMLIIPAGVAHKNLGAENSVGVIGAYPGGSDYDMNYGNPDERPDTDENISKIHVPMKDPLFGKDGGLIKIWK